MRNNPKQYKLQMSFIQKHNYLHVRKVCKAGVGWMLANKKLTTKIRET